MKAEVIRDVVYSTFEARQGGSLERFQHVADDECRTLARYIKIVEQAGYVVTHPDAEISQHVMEAGYRKYGQALYGDPSGWGDAAIAIYRAMLAAITQEGRGMTLADKLRPHVGAIIAAADGGDSEAKSIIALYHMHQSCPSDPGAPALCEATFDDWMKKRGKS